MTVFGWSIDANELAITTNRHQSLKSSLLVSDNNNNHEIFSGNRGGFGFRKPMKNSKTISTTSSSATIKPLEILPRPPIPTDQPKQHVPTQLPKSTSVELSTARLGQRHRVRAWKRIDKILGHKRNHKQFSQH